MSLPLLAAKLIELRHQHGYSQQEVADYLDLTNITKEDLTVLAQYKQLDTQTQQEVQDFIQFKSSRKKKE